MRPTEIPPPGKEWKLLYLNVSLCFVYFVFVFFVFLYVLEKEGIKMCVAANCFYLNPGRGTLSPNYLYRLLSILHSLFNRFWTACSTKSCSFATSAGILVSILHKVRKKGTQYDFNLVPKWTVSCQMSDDTIFRLWHNFFVWKWNSHNIFQVITNWLTNMQFFELCVIGR